MKREFKASIFGKLLLGCLVAAGLAAQSPGQIIPLVSGNSSAVVDTGSQAGMFNWSVEGVNQLAQQWFWYRIGATPEQSINTISAPTILTPLPNQLTTTYANNLLSIRVDYILNGGAIGSGTSQLQESLTINNLSGTALDFHFFQYSDFDLGGTPGGDTVTLKQNIFGKFYEADQSKGGTVLSETTTTGGDPGQPPGADRGEANLFPLTLNSLNDGAPTTLNNNLGPVGPGDGTWALEWDALLNPGDSMVISKVKSITVPEPGAVALAGLGLAVLFSLRRRKSA